MDLKKLTRKARYGHRSYLYWHSADGSLVWASYDRENIKRAILSVGFRGRFYWLDGSGNRHIARRWSMMTTLYRCAPRA